MRRCNNNAWWPCEQRSGQRKHSVAWKSCSKVRLGKTLSTLEKRRKYQRIIISKFIHEHVQYTNVILFVLLLQRCISIGLHCHGMMHPQSAQAASLAAAAGGAHARKQLEARLQALLHRWIQMVKAQMSNLSFYLLYLEKILSKIACKTCKILCVP